MCNGDFTPGSDDLSLRQDSERTSTTECTQQNLSSNPMVEARVPLQLVQDALS
jgi:hypothetical protein